LAVKFSGDLQAYTNSANFLRLNYDGIAQTMSGDRGAVDVAEESMLANQFWAVGCG
jgi:hypothetical protein